MPVDLPTREDFFQIGAQEIIRRSAERSPGLRISREAIFTEGTDANIIVASQSAMADEAARHIAIRDAALFLDSAEGEDLDRLVADRYSPTVVRREAARAIVQATFSRSSPPSTGALVSFDTGTRLSTDEGVEFELTQPAVLAPIIPGQTQAVTVEARAVLAGPDGNVAASTITQFVVPPSDGTVTVSNADIASGGSLRESDESLRARARLFFTAAARGTLSAIEFGALTVDGVATATAREEVDGNGDPTGIVTVFVADQNGQSNSVLASAVRDALLGYRAAGIVPDVVTTTPLDTTIRYAIAFEAGTDTVAASNQIKNLTVDAVNSLSPGATLLQSQLVSIASSVTGAIVVSGSVLEPTGDLVPSDGEVIRTELGLVTVNGV